MLHKTGFRTWIIIGLLVLHAGWILNHLRWVATEQIDPWRLGGYAMYTIPNPGQRLQVYDAAFPDMPVPVNSLKYDTATRFTNAGRTFRCAPVTAAALRAFFEDNGTLVGRNLVLVYSERRFIHSPPSTKREMQGVVIVTWQDALHFTFKSSFCGKDHVETAGLT